jgi:hypothetical protein
VKTESIWTKVGVIAGVVGAVVAVVAFFVTFPPVHLRPSEDKESTRPAVTARNSTSAPSSPSGTIAPNERHLAELPLAQGGGAVRVIDGRDLSMPCGSGQSDDRYRQIEYELPGPYTSFQTHATIGGKADEEASVGVQVFIRARQERSDRILEAGKAVLLARGSEPVTVDMTNARAILLRITCSANTLTVTFTDPRIGR